MNRVEAKKALRQGKRLTHKYFVNGEWVQGVHGVYEFEDGVHCAPSEFWSIRHGKEYAEGWTEIKQERMSPKDGKCLHEVSLNSYCEYCDLRIPF